MNPVTGRHPRLQGRPQCVAVGGTDGIPEFGELSYSLGPANASRVEGCEELHDCRPLHLVATVKASSADWLLEPAGRAIVAVVTRHLGQGKEEESGDGRPHGSSLAPYARERSCRPWQIVETPHRPPAPHPAVSLVAACAKKGVVAQVRLPRELERGGPKADDRAGSH